MPTLEVADECKVMTRLEFAGWASLPQQRLQPTVSKRLLPVRRSQ